MMTRHPVVHFSPIVIAQVIIVLVLDVLRLYMMYRFCEREEAKRD